MPSESYTYIGFESDTAVDKQKPGYGRRATNVRVMPGYVVAAWGNVVKTVVLPNGTNLAVDAISDKVGSTIVWLVWNSLGQHCIVRYDTNSGVGAVVQTWAGFRLPPARGKTQASIIDRFLLFLDRLGQIRCVNLVRAAAGEYTPALLAADPLALHLVKTVPGRRITLFLALPIATDVRRTVAGVTNKIFQFAERWQYRDGGITPLGSFSPLAYPIAYPDDNINAIELVFSGRRVPDLVEAIDLCYRENEEIDWRVAVTLRRNTAGVFPSRYTFYGNTFVSVIPTPAGTKTTEYLPVAVEALGVGNNRVFTGNATDGYNQTTPALSVRAASPPLIGTVAAPAYIVRRDETYTYTTDNGTQTTITRAVVLCYGLESGTYPNPDSRYVLYARGGYTLFPGSTHPDFTQTPPPGLPALLLAPVVDGITVSFAEAFGNDDNQQIHPINLTTSPANPVTVTTSLQVPVRIQAPFLHERSLYQAGIEFYDAHGRPMNATSVQEFSVPANTPVTKVAQLARWQLNTTDPALLNLEIPPEADTYCLLLSRNRSTSYEFQARTADTLAYFGDDSSGDAILKALTEINTSGGRGADVWHGILWLDINNLVSNSTSFTSGPYTGRYDRRGNQDGVVSEAQAINTLSTIKLGYTYDPESGDRIRLLDFDLDAPILYQRGGYLAISGFVARPRYADASFRGQLQHARYEIYSPAIVTSTDNLYQRSPRYDVLRQNGGQPNEQRAYSVRSGWLAGDTYLEEKVFYVALPINYTPPKSKAYGAPLGGWTNDLPETILVESVSPDMKNLPFWYDARRGRPSVIIDGGTKQTHRRAQVNFSNTLLEGTLLNGLSEWEAGSVKDLPGEQGAVTALRLASQNQGDGTILLALQERGAESLYLGKVPLSLADGSREVQALSDLVIGGTNTLTGGYGTRHPASIASNGASLYFFDFDQAEPCRYARDGVTPLASTYGCIDLFRQLVTLYAGASIAGAFDPSTKEYIIFFGAIGTLPGYTVAFSERRKAFTADYANFIPDVAVGTALHLFALKAGQLWRHEETAPPATFFGQFSPPQILLEVDPAPGLGKSWVSVSQDADRPWGDVTLTTETGGLSRLLPDWFERTEGLWQAPVHCDENTPGMPGIQGLYQGDAMHSTTLMLAIRAVPTAAVPRPALRSVWVTYDVLNDQLIGPR